MAPTDREQEAALRAWLADEKHQVGKQSQQALAVLRLLDKARDEIAYLRMMREQAAQGSHSLIGTYREFGDRA